MLLKLRPTILYDAGSGGSGGTAGPPTPPPPTPPPPPPPPDPPPGPVPYDRFRQVNEEKIALEKRLAKLEKAEKERAEEQAAKQGEWEKLAKEREAELKSERTARLRIEVAGKKGIPLDMADRLRGESAEEMEKDAEALLKHLKPKEGPGVPPARPTGGQPPALDFSKMTPEQIREKTKGKSMQELAGKM